MSLPEKQNQKPLTYPEKLTNKTFFRFMFSFVAVIAGVLLLILVLGVGSEIQ